MDLQHVDLETGKDLPLDGFRQAELCDPGAVGSVRIAGHGRDFHFLAVGAALGAGRGEDAWGRGEVEPVVGGDSGVVVDCCPGSSEVAGGCVGFVDDGEVERRHLLSVEPLPARQGGLQGPARLLLALGCLDVFAVDEGGVCGEDDDRPVRGPQRELDGVGGCPHTQLAQHRVIRERADGDHGGAVADVPPCLGGLCEEVQGRDGDEDPAGGEAVEGAGGGGDGLSGSGCGDEGGAGALCGYGFACGESDPLAECCFLVDLVFSEVNDSHNACFCDEMLPERGC